ncbi:uncharacterized protein LOC111341436 [Stylophora pistillata]|uniref:uncharacterized protein LOC111341436 n=1 Tax=Stylophora pistillata TaxID=50429 RepID=UPI000C0530DF|nr:uncharacterized protein LOC111341436 [Stylophora pistillata]
MADVTSFLVKGERFLAVNELKWEKSLLNLPKMSSDNITNFTKKTGKKEMGPKGYKLFAENYLDDVYTASSQQCQWVKGRCYRSHRKTEEPHSMKIGLDKSGNCYKSNCSCKAGSGGHCNVLGLLYLLCHW